MILYVLVISEEPKPAKKLIVSLILRKAKIAAAEKTVDRIIEIIRRTVAFFLNNARKRLIAVRRIVAAMATTRYLVGRISRRNIPTNNVMKEMMAMQAQMRAIRLRRFLPENNLWDFADLDCWGMVFSVKVEAGLIDGVSVVVGFEADFFAGFWEDFGGRFLEDTEELVVFLDFFFTESIVLLIFLLYHAYL